MIKVLEIIISFFQYILNPILRQFNVLLIQRYIYHFDYKTCQSKKIGFEIKFVKIKRIDKKNFFCKTISEKIIYKKQL
jgi:hypothetical protein